MTKKQAIKEAFRALRALSPDEFAHRLAEHRHSELADLFRASGWPDETDSFQALNRYLAETNWVRTVHRAGEVVQFRKNQDSLFLVQKASSPKYQALINNAIYTLSKIENRPEQEIIHKIMASD